MNFAKRVTFGKTATLQQQQLLKTLKKVVANAYEVTGSVPGARPRPRSMRPGNSASNTLNRSATMRGAWFGSMTPPEPTRIADVAAAICPIMISGAELAMFARLWCSATQ